MTSLSKILYMLCGVLVQVRIDSKLEYFLLLKHIESMLSDLLMMTTNVSSYRTVSQALY